jgi:peptidyl-prolyl cis-trans isomerase D
MMQFLRSQSQAVLLVILVVIGGSFLFYGNVGNVLTNGAGRGSSDFGRVGGQDLSVADLYDAVRTTHDSLVLSGRGQELTQPGGRQALAESAWRQILLLHEADVLHIDISNQELIDYIHNLPIFQKDGVYSPDLYQAEMTNLQNSFRISPESFEKVLRNSMRADAVSKALFSTVRASSQDVAAQYEKYDGPTQVTIATLDPKTFEASVTVSSQEIEAEYKAHPDEPSYRTSEKRKVDYVLFPLSPEQAKLPAKDKAPAIEALGEKALDFVLAFQPDPSATPTSAPSTPPDFSIEAKLKGLTPVTTDFFTAETPPAGLPPSPSFNSAAFSLTKENPVSKVVELDNGVAVLHLDEIQPSDLRPLNEVQADIEKKLRTAKALQAEQVAIQNAAQALRNAVAKGADFKTAAIAQKLQVETLHPFIPVKVAQADPRLQVIAYSATGLPVGGIAGPLPVETDNTSMIIHLDSRAPADPAGLAAFATRFDDQQNQQLRNNVFMDWANWEDRQPGNHKPPDLDQYGGVE